MVLPRVGDVVACTGTREILRRIMAGGVHDARALPAGLIDDMHRCGALPGHARAFRSLMVQCKTWIGARSSYGDVDMPVTLVVEPFDRSLHSNDLMWLPRCDWPTGVRSSVT